MQLPGTGTYVSSVWPGVRVLLPPMASSAPNDFRHLLEKIGYACDEKQRARTATGVDRAQAGGGNRRELEFVHSAGLCLFPWFSSFGVLVSGQNRSLCYTMSDGKKNIRYA